MKSRFIATLAMAAAAGSIGLAPIAAAAPTGTVTDTGGATIVQRPGNAQITATPGLTAVQAGQFQYPFYGYGGPGIAWHHHRHHGDHR
ncbi:MAG: hypothetical protein ACXWZI_13475 [Mycobacterium sp.]